MATSSCESAQNDHWEENHAYTALLHFCGIILSISSTKPSRSGRLFRLTWDHFFSSRNFKYIRMFTVDLLLSHTTTYHSFDLPSNANVVNSLLCSGSGSHVPALLNFLFPKTASSKYFPFRPVLFTSTLG